MAWCVHHTLQSLPLMQLASSSRSFPLLAEAILALHQISLHGSGLQHESGLTSPVQLEQTLARLQSMMHFNARPMCCAHIEGRRIDVVSS